MSDDTSENGNPFSVLNRKDFPSARKVYGKIVRHANKPKLVKPAENTPPPDEDAALFLNAVSSAVKLDDSRPARPVRKKIQPAPAPGKDIPDEPVAERSSQTQGAAHDAENTFNPLPMPSREALRAVKKAHTDAETAAAPPPAPAPVPAHRMEQAPQTDSFAALLAESMPEGLKKIVRKLPPSRREQIREDSREAVRREKELSKQRALSGSTDEESFFAEAMSGVAPLDGKGRSVQPEMPPRPTLVVYNNPLRDFMDGKIAFSLAATDEYVEGHVIGLDLSIVGKLQAGQFSPEAHLDLHGLNAEQAFQALVGFMKHSYLCGHRAVLVVPGRGLNSPAGIGVLREKIQEWFTQDPFRRVILAFCTARRVDGGPGSLYVLLRKYRKEKGKVVWDRMPTDPDLYL